MRHVDTLYIFYTYIILHFENKKKGVDFFLRRKKANEDGPYLSSMGKAGKRRRGRLEQTTPKW